MVCLHKTHYFYIINSCNDSEIHSQNRRRTNDYERKADRAETSMNQEWAELIKLSHEQLSHKETFSDGLEILYVLRHEIMEEYDRMKKELTEEAFSTMPFMNANGYHNKTIAYSIYHTFRIEDIVANTLILERKDIFTTGNYKERLNSSIITTGNELVKEEIAAFSEKLNLDALYEYAHSVDRATQMMLRRMSFEDLKTRMKETDKEKLRTLQVVSSDPEAEWLIDYWCSKNIKGLIKMPFSRHWIMHVEAAKRIENKIKKR